MWRGETAHTGTGLEPSLSHLIEAIGVRVQPPVTYW
jgi:hypothetical protein